MPRQDLTFTVTRARLLRASGSTVRLGTFTKTSSTIIAAAMKYGPATAHALVRNLSIPIATQKPPSPTVQFTCSAIIFALGNVMRISRNGDSWRSYHTAWHRLQICQEPIDDLYVVKKKKSLTSIFSLTELGGIIGLTRKPAAEPVVGLQITDLPLIGHRVLQYAHEAHGYSWEWLILGLVELSCEVLSG